MFNRYHINGSPDHVSVSVTEKRAPTDESVRLLREMEKAAQDKVLQAVTLRNNIFECTVQFRRDDFMGDHQLDAIFRINGEKLIATYTMLYGDTPEKAMIGLRDAVAEKVANQISKAFDSAQMRELNLLRR